MIAVMMLDGEVWNDEIAGDYNWAVIDEPGEIIAYSLLVTETTDKKEVEYA